MMLRWESDVTSDAFLWVFPIWVGRSVLWIGMIIERDKRKTIVFPVNLQY